MNCAKLGVLVSILLLCACAHNERLERALEFAGENRAELEKVLVHYKDSGLKLDAARFLIENMPQYYSYEGDGLDSVKALMNIVFIKRYLDERLKKKWSGFSYRNLKKVYDAKVITSDYLIENIDLAFDAWRGRPWNRKVTFDEFCQLILPYRIDDEPLENWRKVYKDRYSVILDSLYQGRDVVAAVDSLILRMRCEKWAYYTDFNLPRLGAMFLLNNRVGGCRESCDLTVYVLRSLGIPSGIDIYRYSPENQHGHLWNVVKDTTGSFIPFWFSENRIKRGGNDGRRKGKVYRICYGEQREKDVTAEYFGENRTRVKVDGSQCGDSILLGIFSPGGWIPVDISEHKDGEALVKNIEPGVIFMPLTTKNGMLKEVGFPFRLTSNGVSYFCPGERETACLWRKYPVRDYVRRYMSGVVGSRITVADNVDFKDSELLYEIQDTPVINYNIVACHPKKKYRYVQYKAADNKRAEIMELGLYTSMDAKEALESKVIYSSAPQLGDKSLTGDKMCDGDCLTYFLSEDSAGYAVLDLGKPEYIGKMVYIPRNDDNFISAGDMYELFYQNGSAGWVSLGKQMAQEQQLIYKNVPQNALLWLRDLSRGREEQVFWIENGKQVFLGK